MAPLDSDSTPSALDCECSLRIGYTDASGPASGCQKLPHLYLTMPPCVWYGGREMHSNFALSDFRKRIPKIDSLS